MAENFKKKQKKKLASTGEVMREYWKILRHYPFLLSLVIIGGILLQAADLAAPLFLRQFFNLLTAGSPNAATVHALVITLALVAAMWLLDWAASRLQGVSNERLEVKIMEALYNNSFAYLLRHSYNFFISHFAGTLTHNTNRYARSFETLFDVIVSQFFPTFLFIVGAISVLFLRNHTLGLFLFGSAIVLLIFQIYISRLRYPIRQIRAESESRVTGALADAISNQNTIALFSGEHHEQSRFAEAVRHWRDATLRSWLSDNWTWGGLNFLMILIQIILLYAAIHYWQLGVLTVGDFVLIQAYLLTTFNRMTGINFQLRRFYDAFADAGEMIRILKTPHEIKDVPEAQALAVQKGEIKFTGVNFGFQNRSVLNNFDLSVAAREKIALVGPSGAGKSTITKLLLRLYDVQSGAIEIDGQNIANVTQDSLRNAIAFVPQEPILFHRTLMENIRYGRRNATDEEVIEAAKKAHCHEFIVQSAEGYNTYVGERGIKLSGGERQRVAIARAILKNAPILVLDEATSSLDSESEALIQDALEVLMRDKTVLVIAHRLSTIMKMDRIVVLEGGKVVAQGTHQELLEQGGLYQKLWSIQAGGFITDDDEKGLSVEEIVEMEHSEDTK